MRPAWSRHRVDTASAGLIATATALGVSYAPLGGPLDGVLWIGSVVRLVDFKSPASISHQSKSKMLTKTQQQLVARGCPVHFVTTDDEMHSLVHAMRRERDGYGRASYD